MKINEVMNTRVHYINKDKTARDAAQLMQESDCGSIPVEDNNKLIGMITDRDLTLQILAEGKGFDTKIEDCITQKIKYCYEDESVENVASQMSDLKIRRIPVMSRDKKLVGIVSLTDLASKEGCQQQAIQAFSNIAM